jgi:serine/threonine protein kinase
MMGEIKMMARLHHPNVIQFLACCFKPYVCLVLEMASKGSLRQLLDARKLMDGPPGSSFAFKWEEGGAKMALGMARGLHYLREFAR